MKFFKKQIESIFNILIPVLKIELIQRIMRSFGLHLPYYRFAEKLNYQGVVNFIVNEKKLHLQSYNKPFEMFIFWYGIFGYWEPLQLKLWSRLVLSADIVLDIGANTGIYSLIAQTNSLASVYAFEPVPDVREMLIKNISLNHPSKIKVDSRLLGDHVGSQTLYIPRSGWVDVASIDKNFAQNYLFGNKMQELVCQMTTVDDFLNDLQLKNNERILCKIDVEGAEEMVLTGMIDSIQKRNITFTMELLNDNYFAKVSSVLPNKFSIYAIDEIAHKIYKSDHFVEGATNYLCTAEDVSNRII
ncbi:hypothetical protein COU87_01065 [Candidatus Roizmanbacteria bacterium CG10_big_fil_rev_8_21_14_0_10_39_12]|uniref:Methyltransferase FkbM domain-containing protein n=1 Tax=Candidatus Roizmanbacteria bacterium CG10_big_fil_rev_8_21_14_0_10_39_12 TaxID=1974852 RepID=A0A2M8KQA9_9BACT|nr:MAG: hypothetical protein COY15_00135 [Candidatus Roizmanbacteria bacterium CG_4_10_14_0_2_um_filter_39_12]PJE62101.1 MAG: hypothetical protein COU87_01065 [Candidatus Roizmanbacteria bacterium CG10_big_fil_rev_8_21_14_0_10_39_12]